MVASWRRRRGRPRVPEGAWPCAARVGDAEKPSATQPHGPTTARDAIPGAANVGALGVWVGDGGAVHGTRRSGRAVAQHIVALPVAPAGGWLVSRHALERPRDRSRPSPSVWSTSPRGRFTRRLPRASVRGVIPGSRNAETPVFIGGFEVPPRGFEA